MISRDEAAQKISNRTSLMTLGSESDSIAKQIHYPECWDTAAYPTLKDAVVEIIFCAGCNPQCCTKQNKEVPPND